MPSWIFRVILDQPSRKYDLSYLPGRDHSIWTIHLVNRMWQEEQELLCGLSHFIYERHASPLVPLIVFSFIAVRSC